MKSRKMRWAEYVACMEEMGNVYRILVGNLKGRDHLVDFMHRWKDNIRMDLRETEWEGVGWTRLVQDRDQCRVL